MEKLQNGPNYTQYNVVHPFAPPYTFANKSYVKSFQRLRSAPQLNYPVYHYSLGIYIYLKIVNHKSFYNICFFIKD